MEIKSNKLIVVLGMHRSGTSVITRALQVLGVNLGDNFLPPKGDNLKGFWEDADIYALNMEMLSAIDSDWHHLAPIEPINVEVLRKKGYFLRAAELLRQKIGNAPTFAFKDPRVAKLMPLWNEVFSHCQYEVSYVIAIRHPLSVVKSLAKRNGFDAEKSYLLWLGHVITSLTCSAGDRRVLVDYDRLMQSPDRELTRITECMGLEIDALELKSYKTEFLEQGLRHTIYDLNDLLLDDACPPVVREVYTDLLNVASDKAKFDDVAIQKKIMLWSNEFERLKSTLVLIDRLFTQKAVAAQAVEGRDVQIASLNQAVAERDGQISSFNQAVAERDRQISSLNQAVAERDGLISRLNQAVVERDGQIAGLNQAAAERDGLISSLNQAVVERDGQIASLNQAAAERDGLISSLNQAVVERDSVIRQILSSTSWRLSLPLRKLKILFININHAVNNTVALGIRPIFARNIHRAKLLHIILPAALSRCGGLMRTIGKAWDVLNREGWSGIKHRVIFLHSQLMRPAGEMVVLNRDGHVEFSRHDGTLTDEARATMLKHIDTLTFQPLISVVVPTFNPKPEWLEKAIESVRKQVYAHWELCIADDASTDENIRPMLRRYVLEDTRIKVVFREKNGGISAASNSSLAIATGEYVALLDHDDELSPDALYWAVAEICAHPDAEVFYSDEDKITPDGSPADIFFKPDWSPELMYNCMYIGHLTVYRKSLIDRVGGFRTKYDFSQDYDLALRATEVAHTVRHIPRILYHWRQTDGSASQEGGKPYARLSNLAALQGAVDRRGLTAQVLELPTANRVKIIGWKPKVSIVIPTDSEVNLAACLDALSEKTSYPSWEIVVVTNSKLADCLAQRYARLPLSFCRYDKPYNFSDKCNKGADQSTGEVVAFFNDDVRPLSDGWLEDLVELLAVPEIGAVAPKLLYEDGRIQYAGMVTGVRGLVGTAFHCLPENTTQYFNFAQSVRDVSVVSGACLAMRRRDFQEVGGFDAINTPIMHSDVDLSFKVREKGLRCVYTPYASLLHIGHQSLKELDKKQTKADQDKSDIYLLKRWGAYVTYDPYFPDNMRGMLYHDSPEPIIMWGQNRPELVESHTDILIVTHDMSASGAPMVAYQAAKHLLTSGAFPVVASPEDGPMRSLFVALGIPVIIDKLLLTRHESVKKLARNFDCVLANTVASWPIVFQLLDEVPVMWYLHESHLISDMAEKNPQVAATLTKATHVYAGSERAASFCQPYNQGVKILTYGVPDIYCVDDPQVVTEVPMVFSVFGTIEPRKGQDTFLEAVRLVGSRADGKAIFNLIGRTLDEGWVTELRKKADDLDNVFFLGEVGHHQYLKLMGESHVIVCPSRDDTLPLVTLDALCLGKMLICTKTTGTSNFMTNGKDGLVVPNSDPEALAEAIVSLIEDTSRVACMGGEGRKTFLRHFAESKFAERLVDEVRGISRKVP